MPIIAVIGKVSFSVCSRPLRRNLVATPQKKCALGPDTRHFGAIPGTGPCEACPSAAPTFPGAAGTAFKERAMPNDWRLWAVAVLVVLLLSHCSH